MPLTRKGLRFGRFLLLISLGILLCKEIAPWRSGQVDQPGSDRESLSSNVRIAPWHEHTTHGESSFPLSAVWTLMLWVVLGLIKHRGSLPKYLSYLLVATGSPFAHKHGARGETVYDCTNPQVSVADVDLSVVAECPAFESTYQNSTLQEVQIVQRTASTLVETYTCNLLITREACKCK